MPKEKNSKTQAKINFRRSKNKLAQQSNLLDKLKELSEETQKLKSLFSDKNFDNNILSLINNEYDKIDAEVRLMAINTTLDKTNALIGSTKNCIECVEKLLELKEIKSEIGILINLEKVNKEVLEFVFTDIINFSAQMKALDNSKDLTQLDSTIVNAKNCLKKLKIAFDLPSSNDLEVHQIIDEVVEEIKHYVDDLPIEIELLEKDVDLSNEIYNKSGLDIKPFTLTANDIFDELQIMNESLDTMLKGEVEESLFWQVD